MNQNNKLPSIPDLDKLFRKSLDIYDVQLGTPSLTLSFDDISLLPADFTTIKSRADVDTSTELCGQKLKLPVLASNMTSVYSPTLSMNLLAAGGMAVVHRFCSIEENVKLFYEGCFEENDVILKPWVSVGLGPSEFERAEALIAAGAEVIVIDVANAANDAAVAQFCAIKALYKVSVVVGNFGTKNQIEAFIGHSRAISGAIPDAFKVSIGSGAACTTRLVTGVGLPSASTLIETVSTGYPIIFDGGIKNSGDMCKALALGAKAVMMGRLFAQCEESGAEKIYKSRPSGEFFVNEDFLEEIIKPTPIKVRYKGSASYESYIEQNKEASFRAPEGESMELPITGTVNDLFNKLNGGLRSSMTYLNARNLNEYAQNAQYTQVTTNGRVESAAHGKDSK